MIMLIIFGMALVTFIPRVIPVWIIDKIQFPEWLNQWLSVIPYAALGALIFPGVLTVVPESPYIGFIGAFVAVLLALLRLHTILVVLGACATVFFIHYL